MKPLHYIIVLFTVICGLGISFLLIPRGAELALMNFKDNRFDEARADYEKRVAAGDLSAAVVNPLSELYLQYGKTEEAIALHEKFVQANPEDKTARQRLATYYQYAQRPHDYLKTLEQLAMQEPSEARLRELVAIYTFNGDEERELATQKKLVTSFPGKPEDLLRLANLQASSGQFSEAGNTLILLGEKYSDQMNADRAQFLASTLLDANRTEEAISRVKAWLRQHPGAEVAARLATTLDLRNQSAAALEIVESFERLTPQSPELLVTLIQLQIKNGHSDKAIERLTRLAEAKQLPPRALEPFLDLLLQQGNNKLAIQMAESGELSVLPDWLLTALADAAIYIERSDFALNMVSTLGEGFLERTPLLGARLSLLRHDNAAAKRWLQKAEGAGGTVQQRRDLASLYLDIKLPDAALRVLDALRRQSNTIEISSTWAVAAAQAGRGAEVTAWLAKLPAAQPSVPTLTDLYYVGQDTNQLALVVAAADRLLRHTRNDETLLRYANALVQAKRTAEALPIARELFTAKATEERESLYLSALTAARSEKLPVEAELSTYWTRKLAAAGVNSKRSEEILFAMLDSGASEAALPTLSQLARDRGGEWLFAYKDAALKANRKADFIEFLKTDLRRKDKTFAAKESTMFMLIDTGTDADTLPFLREFADQAGDTWVFAYEEALTRNGRKDELRDFWIARAGRKGASSNDRYLIAVRMLESGYKPEAERILMDIGKDHDPAASEVSQLLYLWGPRPPDYGLDWLEERVKSSKQPAARAQWIGHLLNAAAGRRVAALTANDPTLLDAYVEALAALSDGANLTKVLMEKLPRLDKPETLRRYAQRALEVSESETARAYFTQLALILPQDRDALRWLGALNYAIGQWIDAEAFYKRYFALGTTDYESDFYFGEILLRKTDFAGANTHFESTLQQIERIPVKTFEKLLAERPKDKNLRADYAGLLIREQRLKDAARVLAVP
jgi:Flp pilus assembly protein TadD